MDKRLKWCGFKISLDKSSDPVHELLSPDGEQENIWYAYRDGTGDKFDEEARESMYPEFDMNFFFQYVVPKLNRFTIDDTNRFENEWQKACIVKLKLPHSEPVSAMAKDPNKAWQEALLKLMEG